MRRQPPWGPAMLAAVVSCTVLVFGCATPRATLNTPTSTCFQALPLAVQALDHQGKLVGVARVRPPNPPGTSVLPTPSSLRPPSGSSASTSAPNGPAQLADRRMVCLIAYRGTFDPVRIPLLRSRAGSRYAIVVVGVRSHTVRAVDLTDQLPKEFREVIS